MITLIVVNAQSDFITGTMCTKDSKSILDPLKKFIKTHKGDIDKIIFTGDWHPYNHCSFKKYGGKYPHHCIQFTPGACIEPKLLKYVQSYDIPYEIFLKGTDRLVDECGAFPFITVARDSALGDDYILECKTSDSITIMDTGSKVVICGIDLDHSLSETINNLVDGNLNPKIYMPAVYSNDKYLNQCIKENNIGKI